MDWLTNALNIWTAFHAIAIRRCECTAVRLWWVSWCLKFKFFFGFVRNKFGLIKLRSKYSIKKKRFVGNNSEKRRLLPVDDVVEQLLSPNKYRLRSYWCLECIVWLVYGPSMINSRSSNCPWNWSQLSCLHCRPIHDSPHSHTYLPNLYQRHC